MEEWQLNLTTDKRPRLLTFTRCTLNLTSLLRTSGFLNEDDLATLEAIGHSKGERAKVNELYQLLGTRENSYAKLIDVLFQTNQTGAAKILLAGYSENQEEIPKALLQHTEKGSSFSSKPDFLPTN